MEFHVPLVDSHEALEGDFVSESGDDNLARLGHRGFADCYDIPIS